MTIYQAIYKCRLCGEEYEGGVTKNANIAMKYVYGMARREYYYPKGFAIEMRGLECHNCRDGSFGLADFQGFKKGEEV